MTSVYKNGGEEGSGYARLRRDYYVIVLCSQHAAILKYDQYKNAYIYMHRQTISINAFLAPTTRGTVVRSVTSGPGLLGKGGGTRVL